MKKLFIAAVIGFIACSTQAAYLYWQVNSSDFEDTGIEAGYARVVAVDVNGTETILDMADRKTGETQAGSSLTEVDRGTAVINLSQLTDPSAYSFFIELVNFNSVSFDVVGKTATNLTYADLVQRQFVDVGDVMMIPQANVWHGTPYSVPEPTGAMLVMFGLGLLALKRKRV